MCADRAAMPTEETLLRILVDSIRQRRQTRMGEVVCAEVLVREALDELGQTLDLSPYRDSLCLRLIAVVEQGQ
jgi:hypothetical protein